MLVDTLSVRLCKWTEMYILAEIPAWLMMLRTKLKAEPPRGSMVFHENKCCHDDVFENRDQQCKCSISKCLAVSVQKP